jgi:hypothetical protein
LITQKDVDILSGKLLEYILQQKKNIITSNFKDDLSVILSFNDLIRTEVKSITVETPI